MIIDDGTGRGYKVRVNSKNRLMVQSAMQSQGSQYCLENQAAYGVYLTSGNYLTATTTGGVVMLIRNDHSDPMIIQRIVGSVGSGGIVWIMKGHTIGTLGNVVDGAVRNLNFASSQAPDATIKTWDGVGDGITGLTGGTNIAPMWIPAATVIDLELNDMFALTNGSVFALHVKGLGSTMPFQMYVSFYYASAE